LVGVIGFTDIWVWDGGVCVVEKTLVGIGIFTRGRLDLTTKTQRHQEYKKTAKSLDSITKLPITDLR
jgi:hypothetical protein